MGREIVYCQSCGSRLTESDFERGKAQEIDNRPFCSRCRPLTAPPPAPPPSERRGTTTTRRKPPTGWVPRASPPDEPPTRRAETAIRRKKGSKVWLAGGGAALVLLMIVAAVATSGRRPVPPPEPVGPLKAPPESRTSARGTEAADRLRELEEFAAAVSDPEAILVRCDQLRASFRETSLEPRFKQVEARAMERMKEKNRAAELDRSLASIRKIIQEDPACARRVEVESLLAATLKTAGPRAAEVQKLQAEYKARCEEAARPRARPWTECFVLAGNRITANDYPGAKVLYLEGLVTLPAARPEDLPQRGLYCAGLYNIACIHSVEAAKLSDAARREAVDAAFRHLDWALRSDYARLRCPCHLQTLGLGHMGEDKDLDPIRADPRFAELVRKYRQP